MMLRRTFFSAVMVAAIVATSACQPTDLEESDMTLDEARLSMLTHVDAITASVGTGWADRYEPATFSCSLPGGDGLQWTLTREGTITESAAEAAARVQHYFRTHGFDVRLRVNSADQIDVIVRGSGGLDVQFGAVDNGFAHIDAQSVCIADEA